MSPVQVSIIIPCFNESSTILEVLRRVQMVAIPGGGSKEIIVVDDGSTDGAGELLASRVQEFSDVRLHRAVTNFGKGAAVRAGMALARGDVMLIQDADLELRPEEIPELVAPILRGETEVVFGSRFLGGRGFRWSRSYFANRVLVWLTRILFMTRLSDMETCYKVMRRSVLDGVRLRAMGFEIEPELTAKILRLGHRIHEVPISYEPRSEAAGKKIRAWDGLKAIYYLFKYRFQSRDKFCRPASPPEPSIQPAK